MARKEKSHATFPVVVNGYLFAAYYVHLPVPEDTEVTLRKIEGQGHVVGVCPGGDGREHDQRRGPDE